MQKGYFSKSLNREVIDLEGRKPEEQVKKEYFFGVNDIQVLIIDAQTEGCRVVNGVYIKCNLAEEKSASELAEKPKRDVETIIQAKMRSIAIEQLQKEGKLDILGKIKEGL